MTDQLIFVGDIHGNIEALDGMLHALRDFSCARTVFLGDYINKGPCSKEILDRLASLTKTNDVTLLAGNHEKALLESIETHDPRVFLKIGGAATVRSYLTLPVGPDMWQEFVKAIPDEHLAILRSMQPLYDGPEVLATHTPSTNSPNKFHVSAHVPTGPLPTITRGSALIDTGCGESHGRLTALMWPSRKFIQVDNLGTPV